MSKQVNQQQPQPTANREHQAVIYLRVASPEKANQTIDQQREACQRIADRYGLKVIRVYADKGRPARLDRQVELQRLLDDLDHWRDAASVIVWDYARLARSMEQLETVIDRVIASDAKIVTLTGVEARDRFQREWLSSLHGTEED